ncbi:MAG: bacterial Ig-like domain-containing protein [Acholeplasmatales bacterium]|nr:bacterial Ig-like domain-containing protein [Acholeplasmatales bacterium]
MKKKNLFVGLLLASAVFSLAACTNKPKPTDTSTDTKEVPATTDKPAESTSDKPAESTSEKPVESTSEKPAESTTPIEERELISFSIDSENVKKEYAVGEKIDLTGLVVKATYDNGDTETVTDYELKVLNGDAEVALDAELAAGTYTISIKVGDKKAKTFEVECKVEQYKFNFDLKASDYNDSLEEPYTADYTYPDGTYTLFDNPSLKLELTAQSSNSQVKFQPGNERTLDDITFTDRFSIHSKYGYMSVTTKAAGKVNVYCTVNGADRQVIIKDGSTQVAIGGTDWTSAELHKITFDAEAGKTYTINSTSNGSVVYAVFFEGSVDASTRVATEEFNCWPIINEFDIKDNKFDPTDFDAIIEAIDNYGVVREVALDECTVTVKNAAQETVEGVITAAGVYQVTVAYDGKEVTFEITVSDPDAKIESVLVDSTAATKTFYEGDSFNADNIEVTAKKGTVDITLTDADYTVKLFAGDDEVTGFDLTGTYEVRVYANDSEGVYGSYNINFYEIDTTEITAADEAKVNVGITNFNSGAKAVVTYDDSTTKDVTSSIVAKYYTDVECETETTTPFAAAGTVYLELVVNEARKVITITVGELTATTENYNYTADNYGISTEEAPTAWTYDAAKVDGFDIAASATDSTKVKLAKIATQKMTYTLAEASNEITLSLTGGTSGSGNASDYLQIDFLDADGNVIETVVGTTPAGKVIGDFTFKSLDGATELTFANATACKSIRFSCTNTSKSVGIATATITSFN